MLIFLSFIFISIILACYLFVYEHIIIYNIQYTYVIYNI